jgi:hypothetical protein
MDGVHSAFRRQHNLSNDRSLQASDRDVGRVSLELDVKKLGQKQMC